MVIEEIQISPKLLRALKRSDDQVSPNELCAVLSGRLNSQGSSLFLFAMRRVRNYARDRGFFVIRTDEVLPLRSTDVFFHSHSERDATLSLHDKRCTYKLKSTILVGALRQVHPSVNAWSFDNGSISIVF